MDVAFEHVAETEAAIKDIHNEMEQLKRGKEEMVKREKKCMLTEIQVLIREQQVVQRARSKIKEEVAAAIEQQLADPDFFGGSSSESESSSEDPLTFAAKQELLKIKSEEDSRALLQKMSVGKALGIDFSESEPVTRAVFLTGGRGG